MKISKEDYNRLCYIARLLNDEDADPDMFELWEDLTKVINNIKDEEVD